MTDQDDRSPARPPTLDEDDDAKAVVEEVKNLRRFLARTAHGGSIVSSAALTPQQIAIARASDRMLVTPDGYGFVYVPRAKPDRERQFESGPGFIIAKACPACLHTKCGEDCRCDCDAARARLPLVDAVEWVLDERSWEREYGEGRAVDVEEVRKAMRAAMRAALSDLDLPYGRWCEAADDGYLCTRPEGHAGDHVAGDGGGSALHRWRP